MAPEGSQRTSDFSNPGGTKNSLIIKKKLNHELGLTTIELLAALSIMSLIALLLSGMLRPPLNALEQIVSRIEAEESLRRFHERMLSDFASVRADPSVQNPAFSFGANYVEIALLRDEPEIVRYAFNENDGLFERTVSTDNSPVTLGALGVTNATISIFDGSSWQHIWAYHPSTCVPTAIRIELSGVTARRPEVEWIIPIYVGREWTGQEARGC